MRTKANRLLKTALALLATGCTVPAVDYTGKTCEVAEDCPNGLVCDPVTMTCQTSAGTPADGGAPADASLTPKDGGVPGDGGPVETDGGAVESDGGTGPDGSVPAGDAGVRVPFAVQTSGGGEASSAGFKLRLQLSSPQPSGAGSSANYRLQLGPVAP